MPWATTERTVIDLSIPKVVGLRNLHPSSTARGSLLAGPNTQDHRDAP
jgi:hypothetical protein